jgi:hypothetical protein
MKNTILKTITAFSVLASTTFVASSAQAVILQNGDFLILDIKFRATDTTGIVPGGFNLVEFERLNGTFAPDDLFGDFTVTDSRLGGVDDVANLLDNGEGKIQSFNLDVIGDTDFTLGAPLDATFNPFVTNTFNTAAGFANPFFTLDLGGGDIVSFDLTTITATQSAPLSQSNLTSIFVSGLGTLSSSKPQNSAPAPVDFSGSIIFNTTTGRFESDGGLVVRPVIAEKTPEASTTMGLLALGLLGGSSLLKKRSKVA